MTRKKMLLISGLICLAVSAVPFYLYFSKHEAMMLQLGILWGGIGVVVLIATWLESRIGRGRK